MIETIIFIVLYGIWLAVAVKYTKYSVLLLPVFFPLYLFKITVLGVPLYFIEGLIVIAAIPVFVKILIGRDDQLLKEKFFKKFLHIIKNFFQPKPRAFNDFLKSPYLPTVLFLIACLVSAVIVPADGSKQALGILKSWIIIPLVYFILLMHSIRSLKDLNTALYSYIASSVFLCLWGMFQALSGSYITIDNRVSGPFESANYLAMYITPAFVYCMVRFLRSFIHNKFETATVKWNKFENGIYIGVLVALFLTVLVLTQSYGGIAGSFAAIFIYIIYERFKVKEKQSKKFLNRFILFILTIFLLGGTLTVVLNYEKFENLAKFDDHTSISTRIEIWKVGYDLIKENPLFGIGLGQYEKRYASDAQRILGEKPFEETRLHSHNLFMEFWLQSGLIGLLSFVWLLILAYRQVYYNLPPNNKKSMIVLIIMLTYIMFHGLIDVPFWKNDLALILWTVLAGIFALNKADVH
ncbi:O-antigen ligase family protein [Candidatus Peregrinibacteria bacterium]|nr:O-antigen ligase family protein [Candidatus Peregrinibacteria bacterium]